MRWVIAALLVNLPYLRFLSKATITPGTGVEEHHGLLARALEPLRVATADRIGYFFDADWPRFLDALHLGRAFAPLTAAALVLLGVLLAVGLIALLAGGEAPRRRLGVLALSVWVGYTLFYAARLLPLEPHYQFPTWWLVPVGLAGALAVLNPRARAMVHALVWTLAIAQAGFVFCWTRFIAREHGTRGTHYGPTVAEQRAVIRAICAETPPGRSAFVENRTTVFRGSLEYLAHTEDDCSHRPIAVRRPGSSTPLPAEFPRPSPWILDWRDPVGARLGVTQGASAP
jgi:hypothetical protein